MNLLNKVPPCYFVALFFAALFALASLWPRLGAAMDRAGRVLWRR